MLGRLRDRSRWDENSDLYALFSLYVPGFIFGVGTGISLPVIPVYARTFETSFGVASMVIVAFMAGSLVATIPGGFLADRFGRKTVLLAGGLLMAASSFLMATAGSFTELLLWRFTAGVANQIWMLSRITLVADSGGARRARLISTLFAVENAGQLVGPAIGGFTAELIDLRAPFLIHGSVTLIAVLPTYLLVREPVRSAAAAEADRFRHVESTTSMRSYLLIPRVMSLLLSTLLVQTTRGSLYGGAMLLYAAFAYNVNTAVLGIVSTFVSATGIPISVWVGHMMDRYGRRYTLTPGLALLALALLFTGMTAWFQMPFPVFVGAFLSVQAAQALTGGAMQTIGSDLAPHFARGQFLGIWRLVGDVGSTLSPTVFALLAETVNYGAAFTWLGIPGALATVILWTQLRERDIKPRVVQATVTAAPSGRADA
jgi:MFS family permease